MVFLYLFFFFFCYLSNQMLRHFLLYENTVLRSSWYGNADCVLVYLCTLHYSTE